MSVSINQQTISQLTDLSSSAQNVIGLLPGGTQLFSRLLQNEKPSMYFPSEITFIDDIWQGTQGSGPCFLKPLKTWITPTTLYYLAPAELTSLSDSSENSNSNANKNVLTTLTNKYEWLTEDTLNQVEQFKSQYGLGSCPLFATASLEDLARFYKDVIAIAASEADLSEAVDFAQTHANQFSAFVDLIAFYRHTANFAEGAASERLNKISALLSAIQPEIEKYLTAPVSQTAPDEMQLKNIQSQWLSQQAIIGFKDVFTGCRIAAQLIALPADYPDQAIANIGKAIEIIEQFFRNNNAQDAFPLQTAQGWRYQYKSEQYVSSLQWLDSGTLYLNSFSPMASQQTTVPAKSQQTQNNKPNKPPRRKNPGANQK
ncbi:MAG: hypothetical protein ACFHVJ_08525 [Aestuariibacter sp.]